MKVLFYDAGKTAPFDYLYKDLGSSCLISNQKKYIDQFPDDHKAQLMDLVSEQIYNILFVPIDVKPVFLEWLRENQHIEWRQKRLSQDSTISPVIGEDTLNEFISNMVVKEEWEGKDKAHNTHTQTTPEVSNTHSMQLGGFGMLFFMLIVLVTSVFVYKHFFLEAEITYEQEENTSTVSQQDNKPNENTSTTEAAKALINTIKESTSNKVDSANMSDIVVLFDQTSSVIPPNSEGEKLVTEIVQTISALFDNNAQTDRRLWSIQEGDEKELKGQLLSSEKQLHLFSFGGFDKADQCDTALLPKAEPLSTDYLKQSLYPPSSTTFESKIKDFYWQHILYNKVLKNPIYESPALAQWQVWKNVQQTAPLQKAYYQILITDGGKALTGQVGECQKARTLEWSNNHKETLLVLNYQARASKKQDLTMTISYIDATTGLPNQIAQLGNHLVSMVERIEAGTTEKSAPTSNTILTDASQYAINNLWVLVAAILVILMQAGFALLEAGFNASKNAVNIMFKNVMDFSLGVLSFFFIGFTLMFGETHYGLFGFDAIMLTRFPELDLSPYIFFLFQAAFAATAATICAGSVAGRLRFTIYLVYSIVITAIIYPISGHWVWGGGWLSISDIPGVPKFHDFAGSVVVHAVGGFAGLAGTLVLKPRLGKFREWDNVLLKNEDQMIGRQLNKHGSDELFPHNLLLAALGMLILWIGWYGFNGGSELGFYNAAVDNVGKIVVNTTLSAAAGAVMVMLVTYFRREKLELTLMLNGAIGGLVGITASCNKVFFLEAIFIGAISGLIVILGVILLVRLKIDDPVGAWPVHGLCGIWGGVAYAVLGYAGEQWFWQILGSVAIPLWSFVTMLLLFGGLHLLLKLLRSHYGIRVSPKEEMAGLDEHHHGEVGFRF